MSDTGWEARATRADFVNGWYGALDAVYELAGDAESQATKDFLRGVAAKLIELKDAAADKWTRQIHPEWTGGAS